VKQLALGKLPILRLYRLFTVKERIRRRLHPRTAAWASGLRMFAHDFIVLSEWELASSRFERQPQQRTWV
jgi:hypothetical protein